MPHPILITGGAGYIGTHTAIALHEAGFTPIIADNFSNSAPDAVAGVERIIGTPVRVFEGDCTDPAFLANVFATLRTEDTPLVGAIHFAAYKAVGESVEQPLAYYRNNITTLLTLLDVAQSHSTAAFPVIFSSSATVYGDPAPTDLPLTEKTPRKPATNPYGNTKTICEDILRDVVLSSPCHSTPCHCERSEAISNKKHRDRHVVLLQSTPRDDSHEKDRCERNEAVPAKNNLRGIALRYFNPIGAHPSAQIGECPTGTPNNLVPYLTQAAAGMRDALTVFGDDYDTPDGTGVRDYIHVCDLADAHVAALRYACAAPTGAPRYDTFNIGTGHGTSVKELITLFERETGVKVPHIIGPRRSGDIAACYANCDKAAQLLNWRATRTIADALRDAWRWEQHTGSA